jgi:hypothetical protein
MEKEILGAYSALFAVCVCLFTLGLTILYRSYKDGDYLTPEKKTTFWLALGIAGFFGSESILRGWWTVWKSGYLSRRAVSWMYDHELVFYTTCVMIISGILLIKSLTEDSPYGRIWQLCAGVVLCIGIMGYLKK